MRTVFLYISITIVILTTSSVASYGKSHGKGYTLQNKTEEMDSKIRALPSINENIFNRFYEYVASISELDAKHSYDESLTTAKQFLEYLESLEGTEITPGIMLQDDSTFEAFGHLILSRNYDRKKMCFQAIYHHSMARDITAKDSTYVLFPVLFVISPEQDYTLYKYTKNINMNGLLGLPPYEPSNCFSADSYYLPFYKLIDPVNVD